MRTVNPYMNIISNVANSTHYTQQTNCRCVLDNTDWAKCRASFYLSSILHAATVLSAHPPPPGALVQVRSVCNSWLPPPSFHLPPTVLATHPFEPTWRWHLLVTLAHLFWCFEGEGCSLVNQQPNEPLTRAFAKPPSGTKGRKEATSGATRTRGYSAGGLSSTSDTSLATGSATNLKRAFFHPPLRKSGSVSQLAAQGNSSDRISASVTGLVWEAAQQKVASHLRVRRASSTSSLGVEQRGTAGEIIVDSGSTADSTMAGNAVSVVSETELVCCPQGVGRCGCGWGERGGGGDVVWAGVGGGDVVWVGVCMFVGRMMGWVRVGVGGVCVVVGVMWCGWVYVCLCVG